LALAILTGFFRLNFAAVSASIAIDDTFLMTAALMFGPGPATLAAGTISLMVSSSRRMPIRQRAYNVAASALTMWGATQAFFLIARMPPLVQATQPVAS